MFVPIQNIVDAVDLTPKDALLPLFECIVNSIISLMQSDQTSKEISIRIVRGDLPSQTSADDVKTIDSILITDNGIGFTEDNYKSFETPFTSLLREHGCKGIGRFTVLAAFKQIHVKSNYREGEAWKYREFTCNAEKEVVPIRFENSTNTEYNTSIELTDCFNLTIKDKMALSIQDISQEIMRHCLIYYLGNNLPVIRVFEADDLENVIVINELFKNISNECERVFQVGTHNFRAYITKTPKEGNRKNHYAYFCANSRVVGSPKNIGKFNSFSYPLNEDGKLFFLDVYVVSEYLNRFVYRSRNGFKIPVEKSDKLFDLEDSISFEEIEQSLLSILEQEYEPHVRETRERSEAELQKYISEKAPRYRSLARNPELLKSIPPNISDDKKEEALYKISFNARKIVEKNVQDFIDNRQINEESIKKIIKDIQDKTAYDVDSLADYMTRRKAIIDLFDKFLEADNEGKYKLEEDIHNLIFPMGVTNDEISYEAHNLWLLDERFLTYKFIASDKSITSISQKNSRKEPDLVMFDNPISFGDKSNGELNSMVIFEFKRPGETAHQKKHGDYRWEFSELVEIYFDEFLYQQDKKNYLGKHVVLNDSTPKFGFIIVDVIPKQLEDYNVGRGWNKTPFGSFYKIRERINLHLEVMTFSKLIEYSKNKHQPFFDKLFGK